MKLLHICSAYAKNELYKRLINEIAVHDIHQDVYVPVRSPNEIGGNDIPNHDSIRIQYDHVLRKYHRLLFNSKIEAVLANLEKKVNVSDKNMVHAHFLFSDGAVALKLKEKYGIPYVVAVRNTDINFFFRYAPHLRKLGLKIMRGAEAIVYLSPAYRDFTFKKYIPIKNHSELSRKSFVIPNGADDFWLENQIKSPKSAKKSLKLLFVGEFTPNKNVMNVVAAVKILRKRMENVTLTMVGGGGLNSQHVHDTVAKLDSGVFNFVGRIRNPDDLMKHYRDADILVLPSYKETFGIVYIEAMSQAMPFICSLGQGVDGYFNDDEPGRFVDPDDPKQIASNIENIYENLSAYSANAIKHVGKFNWETISDEYLSIYKKHAQI